MVADIQSVLRTLRPKEVTVSTEDNHWYLMRTLPYRTLDNVINGAVITFVDVTQQKKTQDDLEQLTFDLQDAKDLAENVIETVRTPLLVLDEAFRILTVNRAFLDSFPGQRNEVEGCPLFEAGKAQWDIPELRQLLGDILPKRQIMHDFKVVLTPKDQEPRTILLNAREIRQKAGKERLILLGLEVL
jgi:two-component system CheB/CheR fusion protein